MLKSIVQIIKKFFLNIAVCLDRLMKGIKKRFFPKNLLGRFILIILLPLILLQIVAFMVFFENHWHLISRRLANDIAGEIDTISLIASEYPEAIHNGVLEQMGKNMALQVTFLPNKELNLNTKRVKTDAMIKQVQRALSQLKYPFWIEENLDEDHIFVYVQLDMGIVKIRVFQKRFFSTSTYVFLLWMVGASILLFWIAFLFMKNQVRAMARLAHAAENFGTGRPVDQFRPEGATEVKQAGLAFLNMQNRISRYLLERTGMLSGVSHDLKTPLTRMKLQLSMTRVEGSDELLEDIEEMERMLEGYLSFAKGEGKEAPRTMEVTGLIEGVVDKLKKNGHIIDLHVEQKQEMTLRPNDFVRAITNVLTNAHRYAHRAYVNVGVRDKFLDITIDDDGNGIPDDQKQEVFKAFYRLDESRNTKTGGVGLGLTITRDIILSHGGDITLEDSPQKGLRVHIKLPL